MSIAAVNDKLTLGQRLTWRQTPDEQFFDCFAAAYVRYAETTTLPPPHEPTMAEQLLEEMLGSVHTELSRRRGVGPEDQAAYARILNRAYTEGGMLDPAGFLRSLSKEELAVVQRNHCLADPIAPDGVSREGAYNLLLPEGWRVDFNKDDLIEVGIGRTIQFPPADAPAEFVDAWMNATRDMGEMDIATYGLVMFSSMHNLPMRDDEPLRRTLPAESMDSYRHVVANFLDMLERLRGQLADGQYERDKEFFGRLMKLMG